MPNLAVRRSLNWPLSVALCVLLCMCSGSPAFSQDVTPPRELLARFQSAWDDAAWVPSSSRRPGYLRPLDDKGWKQRMLVLQGLVQAGEKSLDPLVRVLRDGKAAERILAAQTLGYLPAKEARDDLLKTAEHDAEPAVRLYAVDALGMSGAVAPADFWQRLAGKEKNRDVKRHIAYARERKGATAENAIAKRLTEWDGKRLDTARLGKPAPDFELSSLDGKKVRLSDFRGKKHVVLVFIYGDT